LDGKISTTFRLKPQMVSPFSFPISTPVDEKNDGVSFKRLLKNHSVWKLHRKFYCLTQQDKA
jgi:hypothetical protein